MVPESSDMLRNMVSYAPDYILHSKEVIEKLVQASPRRLYILGAGARYGIALEGALKSLEMANENAYAFGPLEFRHGPWGSVSDDDLIVVLGQTVYARHERQIVQDLAQRTSRLLVIAHESWFDQAPGIPGHRLVLPGKGDDLWMGPLAVIPLQWIGWHWAVNTGRNPDAPRDLTAVVDLNYGF